MERNAKLLWRREFPADYDVPEIVSSQLQDVSWHNDACPMFQLPGTEQDCDAPTLIVDHPAPSMRVDVGGERFMIAYSAGKNGTIEDVFSTHDVDAAIAKLKEIGETYYGRKF